jgi:glycosyltransferase involved in cell wall biosynthesis
LDDSTAHIEGEIRPGSGQRVLLVGPTPPPATGQSIAFRMLLDGLRGRRTYEVVDIADRAGRRDAQFSARRAVLMLGSLGDLLGKLRKSDLVYLQIAQSRWGFLRDGIIILLARLLGRRVVAHLHGGGYADFYDTLPSPFRRLVRMALWKIDLVIILSEGLRSNFAFMGARFAERLRIVANASAVPLGRRRGAPGDKVRLLYLSNLLVEKGYFDCIDALVHLQRMFPQRNFELTLAGAFLLGADDYETPGDLRTETEKRIRYLGLGESVRIAGVVSGREKIDLLDSAHFLLLPTYYRNEGQPISVIEGISRGAVGIVTDWRGTAEIFGDAACGSVVNPMSPIEIAEAVGAIIADPEKYERYSRNAVDRAAQFSVEAHINAIEKVMDEIGPR